MFACESRHSRPQEMTNLWGVSSSISLEIEESAR
nr:MAG TPA: hypothetical protein [Caudoviricetes sp.]